MAACKRAFQLGMDLKKFRGLNLSNVAAAADRVQTAGSLVALSGLSSSGSLNQFSCRQISQLAQSNGKRAFLVDTLALVIRLCF